MLSQWLNAATTSATAPAMAAIAPTIGRSGRAAIPPATPRAIRPAFRIAIGPMIAAIAMPPAANMKNNPANTPVAIRAFFVSSG
jgi:hypothetical protein